MFKFFAIIILMLDIWAAIDAWSLRRASDLEKKILWIIVIFLLPLVGVILYVIFGTARRR